MLSELLGKALSQLGPGDQSAAFQGFALIP